MGARRIWTREECDLLEYCYEDTSTVELADLLGRPLHQIYGKARKLGLSKSEEFMRSEASGRIRSETHRGRLHQFPKGHVPANKGLRRPGYAPGRMAETQFQAGVKGRNWIPVGSIRINADGYLDLKVEDTGYPPVDWRGAHVLLWEDAHGPVPKGHAVAFRDGDKGNVVLENLELLSRAELMLRNTVHNLPRPLVQVIMLNGVLKRKLRRLDREKQDERFAQPPV